MDVFGDAVLDYQKGLYTEDIITYSSLDEEDVMPLPYLFRDFESMPPLEQKALQLCKGSILDIGCGAGSHSLYLQKEGYTVMALDTSAGAIETCRLRGISNLVLTDIMKYEEAKYDTLLLLMNGIGLAGTLKKLLEFLSHLKKLLKPNGQILLDSSDIIYMFDEDKDGGRWVDESQDYYGEVRYVMQYKDQKSLPFSWLYVDQNTLKRIAESLQFSYEIVSLGNHYDYLARLSLKK